MTESKREEFLGICYRPSGASAVLCEGAAIDDESRWASDIGSVTCTVCLSRQFDSESDAVKSFRNRWHLLGDTFAAWVGDQELSSSAVDELLRRLEKTALAFACENDKSIEALADASTPGMN